MLEAKKPIIGSGQAEDLQSNEAVLPLEVDLKVAETFVRIAYRLDSSQRFQSTTFLTPRLRTQQAAHLVRLVERYNDFEGAPVADAIQELRGIVSGVEFGREGSPVIYLEFPYWTHQREEADPKLKGERISDQEFEAAVSKVRAQFVEGLRATEFSVWKRRVRIWWS